MTKKIAEHRYSIFGKCGQYLREELSWESLKFDVKRALDAVAATHNLEFFDLLQFIGLLGIFDRDDQFSANVGFLLKDQLDQAKTSHGLDAAIDLTLRNYVGEGLHGCSHHIQTRAQGKFCQWIDDIIEQEKDPAKAFEYCALAIPAGAHNPFFYAPLARKILAIFKSLTPADKVRTLETIDGLIPPAYTA